MFRFQAAPKTCDQSGLGWGFKPRLACQTLRRSEARKPESQGNDLTTSLPRVLGSAGAEQRALDWASVIAHSCWETRNSIDWYFSFLYSSILLIFISNHVILLTQPKFCFNSFELSSLSDYFIGESFDVCAHRLNLLLERRTLQVALNFSGFLVSTVFNPEKQTSSLIVQRWLADAKDITILLDIHIGLMFKLKKSSYVINREVTNYSTWLFSETLQIIDVRHHNRY